MGIAVSMGIECKPVFDCAQWWTAQRGEVGFGKLSVTFQGKKLSVLSCLYFFCFGFTLLKVLAINELTKKEIC